MRKSILCVEDHHDTAVVVAKQLNDRGFAVSVAHSGPEGLLAVMTATPDLIICDLDMPVMSGFDFFDRLTEFAPRIGQIPVVFLMTPGERGNEAKGRRLKPGDYVTKPVDFEHLHYVIHSHLVRTEGALLAFLPLNNREIDILSKIARGLTSARIADELHLSRRTIDYHVDNARLKLSATTRAEAVMKAVARGLIAQP
jgi:DNA-binding NarL/FixJ family response regulator